MEYRPKYFTEVEVSEITRISLSTLRNDRFKRTGIPYVKIGRSVRYNLSDGIDYMESRKIQTEDHRNVTVMNLLRKEVE
jgi:hypothetical protein